MRQIRGRLGFFFVSQFLNGAIKNKKLAGVRVVVVELAKWLNTALTVTAVNKSCLMAKQKFIIKGKRKAAETCAYTIKGL